MPLSGRQQRRSGGENEVTRAAAAPLPPLPAPPPPSPPHSLPSPLPPPSPSPVQPLYSSDPDDLALSDPSGASDAKDWAGWLPYAGIVCLGGDGCVGTGLAAPLPGRRRVRGESLPILVGARASAIPSSSTSPPLPRTLHTPRPPLPCVAPRRTTRAAPAASRRPPRWLPLASRVPRAHCCPRWPRTR